MDMNEQRLHQLIDKFLEGKAAPEEQAQLEEWFRSFSDIQAVIEVDAPVNKQELKERLFSNVMDQIQGKSPAKLKKLRLRYGTAAACVLLVGVISFLAVRSVFSPGRPLYKEWQAAVQMEKITLDDSTLVWLHRGSHLKYAETPGSSKREVFLEGEAFFEVRHDPRRPFVVHRNSVEIRDIGTKFNVKAYADNRQWEVTVWQGEVSVRNGVGKGSPDKLVAGQEWMFDNSTHTASIVPFNNAADTSLQPGRFCFSNEYLSDITMQLEKQFDVSIRFAKESYKELKFSGVFSPDESLEHLLFVIGKADGIKIKHHDKTILLY